MSAPRNVTPPPIFYSSTTRRFSCQTFSARVLCKMPERQGGSREGKRIRGRRRRGGHCAENCPSSASVQIKAGIDSTDTTKVVPQQRPLRGQPAAEWKRSMRRALLDTRTKQVFKLEAELAMLKQKEQAAGSSAAAATRGVGAMRSAKWTAALVQ